jgi:hypothetical protein
MNKTEANMKTEPKIKKLTLKKETLRDLTAQNAGEVKGGQCGLWTSGSPPRTWVLCPGKTAKCATKKQGGC